MSKLKFQIGDRVGVVRRYSYNDFDIDFQIGHRGKIIVISECACYTHTVQRNGGHVGHFNARELKLIG